jgi:acetoin utilization protein AcuB
VKLADHTRMPTVAAVMTPFPYSVHVDDPVGEVERLMSEHGIRHIPVLDGEQLVGLISERDLHHRVHPSLPARDKARIHARAVMLGNPYSVEITASLADVVADMATQQIGCAVVLRHGRLAGIFSTVDACRILEEILRERFSDGNPDAA